jgi:glycosyltransferase involved in cell wall biosynthesis
MARPPARLIAVLEVVHHRLGGCWLKLRAEAGKAGRWPLWLDLTVLGAVLLQVRAMAFLARRLQRCGALVCRLIRACGPKPPAVPAGSSPRYRRRTFSALLCNYNHAEFIERAILAVVNQSRPPDEYLILDDGSTDHSVEIISDYAAKHPFIKLIRKPRNEGYIKGIKELTARARGEYLHRGASDDYMLPGFIEQAMALAEKWPRAGIISGEMLNGYEDHTSRHLVEIPGWATGYVTPNTYLHEYLEEEDPRCTLAPSTFFRKAAVEEVGGWREELGTWEVSFALQACALKYGMCYLDTPCYTWIYRKKAWSHRQNGDLELTLRIYANYMRLICSPPFGDLFSESFARKWLKANLEQTAETIATDLADKLRRECSQDGAVRQARAA